MSKHTPGPWVAIEGDTFNRNRPWGVSRYLSRQECEEIDGDASTWPSRTEVIAEVCGGSDPEQVKADARLIAAAPELLEALEHVYEVFAPINDSVGGYGALVQARAAIDKAKGGA